MEDSLRVKRGNKALQIIQAALKTKGLPPDTPVSQVDLSDDQADIFLTLASGERIRVELSALPAELFTDEPVLSVAEGPAPETDTFTNPVPETTTLTEPTPVRAQMRPAKGKKKAS